jgi:hypothetical protein
MRAHMFRATASRLHDDLPSCDRDTPSHDDAVAAACLGAVQRLVRARDQALRLVPRHLHPAADGRTHGRGVIDDQDFLRLADAAATA